MPEGVDISHWQASVNLARASEVLDFIFLKATESTDYTDPTFASRWAALGAIDTNRGAYHFAHPASPVQAQVDHYLRKVEPVWRDGDVAILDLEGTAAALAGVPNVLRAKGLARAAMSSPRQDVPWETVGLLRAPSPAQLAVWAADWLDAIRAELGTVPVLYTFPSFYRDTMGNPDLRDLRAVGWIARYGPADPWAAPWTRLKGWPVQPIWQCSNGVAGCVHDVPGLGKTDYNKMPAATANLLFGPPAGLAGVGPAPSYQTRAEAKALLAGLDASPASPAEVN